jgi:sortase A
MNAVPSRPSYQFPMLLAAWVVVATAALSVPQGHVEQAGLAALRPQPSVAPATPPAAPAAAIPAEPEPTEAPAKAVPPAKAPRAPKPIGEIRIPKIGLVHPIYEGIDLSIIDYGPGHWPYTALPGKPGNAVFPGHRVTHSHPFLEIDKLVVGDEVIFHMPYGVFTYKVTETRVIDPYDLWMTDQTPFPSMTLVACHPPHSARQRYMIKGRLEGS